MGKEAQWFGLKLETDQIPAALTAFAEAGSPRLLFVTHAWGGGVEQHVATLARLVSDRARVMVLRPADENTVEIELDGKRRFRLASDDWRLVLDALKAMRFDRVHIHQVHGLPQAILGIDLALAIPLDCTLHDYTSVCPQYQLVDPDGRYCGEPDEAGCNHCIGGRPHPWRLNISQWREAFACVLARADRVFAPSLSVVQKIQHYFPSVDVIFLPHPERTVQPPQLVKVALLGALSNAKGLSAALSVALRAEVTHSPLLLRLIGHAAAPLPSALTATGSYEADDLPRLIASERPDVIWLPSQVPETFSYTLSAALASGLPIVASNMGALADRLRDVPQATLLAYDATSADWHDALLAAAKLSPHLLSQEHASNQRVSSATQSTPQAYAARYLQGLPQAVATSSATPAAALFSTGATAARLTRLAERPLLDVFRIGVYGGHKPSTKLVERALEAIGPDETDVVGRAQYQLVAAELHALTARQAQYVESMEATRIAHAQESQRWHAELISAEERAQGARDHISHLEASVGQHRTRHEALAVKHAELLASASLRGITGMPAARAASSSG